MTSFKPGAKFQFLARDPWKKNGRSGVEISTLHCSVTKVNPASIDFVIERVSSRDNVMPGSTGRWQPGDKWNFKLSFVDVLITKKAIITTEVN